MLDLSCRDVAPSEAELHLAVTDTDGGPMPGVPVSVVAADPKPGDPPASATVTTGPDGMAVLSLPGNRPYLVSTGFVGFVPRSEVIFLRAGCYLRASVKLPVAPVDEPLG